MIDTYRTSVNPYAVKAAEARAKLQAERAAIAETERKRTEMLREINEAVSPLYVYIDKGVRLSLPQLSYGLLLCEQIDMLDNLPRVMGSTRFAEAAEKLEREASALACRDALLPAVPSPSLVKRLVFPVGTAAVATVGSCALFGDFAVSRLVFVFACLLAVNLWLCRKPRSA